MEPLKTVNLTHEDLKVVLSFEPKIISFIDSFKGECLKILHDRIPKMINWFTVKTEIDIIRNNLIDPMCRVLFHTRIHLYRPDNKETFIVDLPINFDDIVNYDGSLEYYKRSYGYNMDEAVKKIIKWAVDAEDRSDKLYSERDVIYVRTPPTEIKIPADLASVKNWDEFVDMAREVAKKTVESKKKKEDKEDGDFK